MKTGAAVLGEENSMSGMVERLKTASSSPLVLCGMVVVIAAIAGFVMLDLAEAESEIYHSPLREKALPSTPPGSPVFAGERRIRLVSEPPARGVRDPVLRTYWKIASLVGLGILLLYFVFVLVTLRAGHEGPAPQPEMMALVLRVEDPAGAPGPGAAQEGGGVHIPIDASIPALEGCYLTDKIIRCGFEMEDKPGEMKWSSTPLTSDMLKSFHKLAEKEATAASENLRKLIRGHPLYPLYPEDCSPEQSERRELPPVGGGSGGAETSN